MSTDHEFTMPGARTEGTYRVTLHANGEHSVRVVKQSPNNVAYEHTIKRRSKIWRRAVRRAETLASAGDSA